MASSSSVSDADSLRGSRQSKVPVASEGIDFSKTGFVGSGSRENFRREVVAVAPRRKPRKRAALDGIVLGSSIRLDEGQKGDRNVRGHC